MEPPKSENAATTNSGAAAAKFDRPLLLTAGQDIAGYLGKKTGAAFLTLVTSLTLLAVLLIFIYIVGSAIPFFRQRGLTELFAGEEWYPSNETNPRFGAQAMLYGSAVVTLGAIAIAVPLGLMAAIFLSDIVAFRARQIIKPIVEILAAIPSVAYGFFAILVIAPWLQNTWGFATGANAITASVMLAIMALPTVVSLSEDAISATGRDLREGAYALGATRAEVMVRVVLPAAHSGIMAAVILGVMRAIGETMLVWMASGAAHSLPHPWWDLRQSIGTLTAVVAAEMGEAPAGGLHRSALFAIALILLLLTFVLNLFSEYFIAKAKRLTRGITE